MNRSLRVVVALIALTGAGLTSGTSAQTTLAWRVERAIKAAGVAVTGVRIGDGTNKASWTVQPSSLQAAAQPTIDAFDVVDPAAPVADADEMVDAYYKDRNVLAMVAVILEKTDPTFLESAPGVPQTNPVKRAKVVAAAVRFNQQRKWVERNFAFFSFPATP